jgi:hypothetical protein
MNLYIRKCEDVTIRSFKDEINRGNSMERNNTSISLSDTLELKLVVTQNVSKKLLADRVI